MWARGGTIGRCRSVSKSFEVFHHVGSFRSRILYREGTLAMTTIIAKAGNLLQVIRQRPAQPSCRSARRDGDSYLTPTPSGRTCKSALVPFRGRRPRPLNVLAFTPPAAVLRCLLREPSFVTGLQAWRNEHQDDQVAEVPPTLGEPFSHRHVAMTSVSDGSAWRKRAANRRQTIERGIVRDVINGSANRLVAIEFGLLAALNLDW